MKDQETRRMMRPGVMLCLCCAMAACGGGSSDDSANEAAPKTGLTATPTPAPEPAPVAEPSRLTIATVSAPVSTNTTELASASVNTTVPVPVAPDTAMDTSCGLNGAGGIQAEVLQQVNAWRAAGAVCGSTIYAATAPLIWNNMLLKAASGHSSDMAQNNYFSHTSLDGRTLVQRIRDAGYSFSAAAENIAAGQSTVQEVVARWINSPGHCQNLMNPVYRDIGVACMRNDAASYGLYWTMNLGRN